MFEFGGVLCCHCVVHRVREWAHDEEVLSVTVDDQLLTPAATSPSPKAPADGSQSVSVVAVVIASIAMIAALVSVGVATRAIGESHKARSSAGPVIAGGPASLAVAEHDFAITPGQASIREGVVDLHVTNSGPSQHELLIFRTDLAPSQLPLGPDGRVDEGGDGVLKVFDSGNSIDAGATKVFHTALAAGNYVLVCNLPGHYRAGMHTAFTVTG